MTWGYAYSGGDSTGVQDQLRDVKHIHAASEAFAAILGDGTVVTWGDPDWGGDSTRVRGQLRNVQSVRQSGLLLRFWEMVLS